MGVKAGYLNVMEKEGVYIGGFMVVDESGIPLEFKHTEKIEPTKIQRVIYGKILDKYLKENVISKALIKEIKFPPDFIVVSEYSIIEGKDKLFGFPCVFIQKTSLQRLKESGDTQRVKEKEILFQPYQDTNPVRIVFGVVDPELQDKVILKISELSRKSDILEPLERVEKALELIWQENL